MDTIIPRQFNYNETNIFLAFSIQLIVNLTIAKVTPTFFKTFFKMYLVFPTHFYKVYTRFAFKCKHFLATFNFNKMNRCAIFLTAFTIQWDRNEQ